VRRLAKQIQYLGKNEYQRAVRIAVEDYDGDNQKVTKAILSQIELHRKRFSNGSTMETTEFWKKVAADADRSAQEELLAGSPQLAELNKLESEADAAKSKAERKAKELDGLWSEFQSLPGKAERARAKLSTNRQRFHCPLEGPDAAW
jgi:hypothetical protein